MEAITSPLGLLSVSADVVILLALAATVACPKASALTRAVIASFAFACAWLMTAGLDAIRAPGWTIFLGAAVIAVSIVVTLATLHVWARDDDKDEYGPGHGGHRGDGGTGPDRPEAPSPGDEGSTPSWWPEFERQFALYVAERETPVGQHPIRESAHLADLELGLVLDQTEASYDEGRIDAWT